MRAKRSKCCARLLETGTAAHCFCRKVLVLDPTILQARFAKSNPLGSPFVTRTRLTDETRDHHHANPAIGSNYSVSDSTPGAPTATPVHKQNRHHLGMNHDDQWSHHCPDPLACILASDSPHTPCVFRYTKNPSSGSSPSQGSEKA